MELREPLLALDPVKWKLGSAEYADNVRIAGMVFDRLVTLDRFGRFQPGLAAEWSHDAGWRRWQFTLRAGAVFSDGSPLTAGDVAGALQELLPQMAAGKTLVTAAGAGAGARVVVQFPAAVPDLLEQLASGQYFIYRRAAGGTLLGTGAFSIKEFVPAAGGTTIGHYKLAASEHCWAGRPFVDTVEVSVGVPALRQLIDLQLGKADVVEISPDLMRRAAQENLRVWASAPLLLYALQVSVAKGAGTGAAEKAGVGEALSLAMDRATMANVLLQRQAEAAGSFLPQWLSGYAFVFDSASSMESSVARAKEMSAELFAGTNGARATVPVTTPGPAATLSVPLRLRVDAGGDLAKLIAERVAINARQGGIPVQVLAHGATREIVSGGAGGGASGAGKMTEAGLRLVAWRYSSLSERAELEAMVEALQLDGASDEQEKTVDDAGQSLTGAYMEAYVREGRLIAERELIPLVAMPEYIGLGAGVRDWTAERWGEWHLADVWLDGKRAAGAAATSSATPSTTSDVTSTAKPSVIPSATCFARASAGWCANLAAGVHP